MKIKENYTIHEDKLTQHESKFEESKFEETDQTLHEQNHKQEQIQKLMDNLELVHTGQDSRIMYVYRNMKDLNQHPKFYGDANENPIEFLRQCEKTMKSIGNHLRIRIKLSLLQNTLEIPQHNGVQ